ncbi:hydroxyjasmonate sulfotransferase [Ranunculus cassubicifolius]
MATSLISLASLHPLPKYLHEDQDEATPESKDLMSTLPRENGWALTHLYQYQGFWHTTRQLQGVLASQTLFHAQPTDLFLVTTLKSGTTWLKAMAYSLVNRVRSPDFDNHPLLSHNPHDLVPFLELKLYVNNNVPDFTNSLNPRLFSTHMPYNSLPESVVNSNCKVVYLCRNPGDTFISLWHFANKLRPKTLGDISLEEARKRFCKGVSLYGPYWDHYEEIKEEPQVHLRRLAEFLGCPFSLEEEEEGVVEKILKLCSFENLRNLEVNKNGKLSSGEENNAFFRRGEVGDSVNYLTVERMEHLNWIIEEKFKACGLKF